MIIKIAKYLITLFVFSLLAGCKSEGAFSDSAVTLQRIDISVASRKAQGATKLVLNKGNKQTFVAVGHYSNGTSRTLMDLDAQHWHSSDINVGFFNAQGVLVSGNATGVISVHVDKDGVVSNTINVHITDAEMTDIVITPATVDLAKGQTQQLTATAIYSDNTSADITSSVTWSVQNTATATVNSSGLLTATQVGNTSITAGQNGVTSNTVNVNVTSAIITAITVTPATVDLAKGQTQQLIATAIYSDNTSSDISNSASWRALDSTTAAVAASGLLAALDVGSTMVTASKDGVTSNTVNVNVTNAIITAITVTPAMIGLAKGQNQQLTATATYSDHSSSDISNSVTWLVQNTAIATITPSGLLAAVDVGSTSFTAAKDGVTSNTVNVSVTSAIITAITVTPPTYDLPKGLTAQLAATAIYSDNTSSDVSHSVTWLVQDIATATVTPSGLLAAVDVGSTSVTAVKDGVTSNTVNINVTSAIITTIRLTPDTIDLAKGQTQLFTAMGTYSDSSIANISSSVTWLVEDTAVATVTLSGLLAAVDVGSTSVTVVKDGVTSNTVNINVTSAIITTISLTPDTIDLAKGQTQLFTATATYSDSSIANISSSATWLVEDTAVATVTPSGLLAAVDVGTTRVTVVKEGISSNTVNVNVTSAVISAITITPFQIDLGKGANEQLTAMATYSDGSTSDISDSAAWLSDNTAIATVTPSGLLTAVAVGNTTLRAVKDGVTSNTVDVNVTPPVVVDIRILPLSLDVIKGQNRQLSAIAVYSDSTTLDITSSVTWRSEDTSTATVSMSGLLFGVELGKTKLSAEKDGITSNMRDVTVCTVAGPCIDLFDTGNGKLFTNSPSIEYLETIGITSNNSGFTEDGRFGPVGNYFAFDWNKAHSLCQSYSAHSLAGRTNWRLPSSNELKSELYDTYGNMTAARNWSTLTFFWSSTSNGSEYYGVCLRCTSNSVRSYRTIQLAYASCVSDL